jgi:hypothetical protein
VAVECHDQGVTNGIVAVGVTSVGILVGDGWRGGGVVNVWCCRLQACKGSSCRRCRLPANFTFSGAFRKAYQTAHHNYIALSNGVTVRAWLWSATS